MERYAQINLVTGICIGVSDLNFPKDYAIPPELKKLAENAPSPIGKKYSNGNWIDNPLLDINLSVVLTLPRGFGGPTGQEVFNG